MAAGLIRAAAGGAWLGLVGGQVGVSGQDLEVQVAMADREVRPGGDGTNQASIRRLAVSPRCRQRRQRTAAVSCS